MGKYAKRGLASMTPEKRKAIASKGGTTVHQRGTAREWTREEAIAAGSKGGKATRKKRQKDIEQ